MSRLDDEIDDLVDEDLYNEINEMSKKELIEWLEQRNIAKVKNKSLNYYKNLVIKRCALDELQYDDLIEIIKQKYQTRRKLYNILNKQIIQFTDNNYNLNYDTEGTIKEIQKAINRMGFSNYSKKTKNKKWYQNLYTTIGFLNYNTIDGVLTILFNNYLDIIAFIMREEEFNTRKKL